MVHWDSISGLPSAGKQGGLGICRKREQQDPGHPAAERRSYGLSDEENLRLKVPTCMLDPI